ncbi:MAG: nucleotidyl transferase AbiEii/AbiGii toxin family protein [Chloroflexota bacterium]|nr:nucleotidyl transferase AbiEii/AbiGii toxin family protein [Chloroflexota bacterium]
MNVKLDINYYFELFYPFQDRVLHLLDDLDTEFYLSGGTAAARGYLQHRFSDELDFSVNDDARFGLWAARAIDRLTRETAWRSEVLLREERFVRLVLYAGDILLKLEFINDVPARVGPIAHHAVLGRLDSPENILANKITALIDREEPKDLADIWGFCCQMHLSLAEALGDAQSKAAGVFPADLARLLLSATRTDWEQVRWIKAPTAAQFLAGLRALGEALILVAESDD